MNYPIVRLVSAPDVDATTRFDFHEWADDVLCCWTDPNEWQIQPGALLGEPDGIGADFGLGSVTFNLYVGTSRRDALGQMGRLARELRREENYLLFQLSADTPPIWYRTYKASPGALGFPFIDPDADEDVWVLPVSLVTDATGLGEQVSHTLTITNDPADGGLFAVLPEIVGDAPAPLVIDMPVSAGQTWPLFNVAAYDTAWPGLQFWQAESWTTETDAAVTADATASGGSRVTVDFATEETTTVRLNGTVSPVLAGRWLLLARMDPTGAGANTVTVKGVGAAVARPIETTLVAAGYRLVPLGEYVFPFANMPTTRPYEISPGDQDVMVLASRSGGSVSLHIDYIVAIPLDGLDVVTPPRMLAVTSTGSVSDDAVRRFNGECECYEEVHDVGGHQSLSPTVAPTLVGSFPQVVPGAGNVLHFLPEAKNTILADDQVTTSQDLTLTYRPRHLWLPGS